MDQVVLTEIDVTAGEQYFHGRVQRVLGQNPGLEDDVIRAVSGRQAIVGTLRKKKGAGVTATSLNVSLKSEFHRTGGWSFEATVRDGVIFDSISHQAKTEGFDLARYDARWNVARMWSLCFGSRRLANGDVEWARFRARRPDLTVDLDWAESTGTPGNDLDSTALSGVVLGDIQFGNWGLGYRDLLRLIDADEQLQVDLYVYVTGLPSLNALLSDGIVNFQDTKRNLQLFARLVRVPVWVVGLDLSPSAITPASQHAQPSRGGLGRRIPRPR
jgi:hypothetical protein